MAAASERPGELLARLVVAHPIVVGPASDHPRDGLPHSRLADGRIVCWPVAGSSPYPCAVDAEITATRPPPALSARWGNLEPALLWRGWTRTEVVAKLGSRTLWSYLPHGPVPDGSVELDEGVVYLCTDEVEDLTVTWGLLSPRSSSARRDAAGG